MENLIPYDDLVYSEPHSGLVTFKSGTFYSPYQELSEEGLQIMGHSASLNNISEYLYYPPILNWFIGYATDEILHLYPGRKMEMDYTPIVKEWFYLAAQNPNRIAITEPYFEKQSDTWIVSVSKAIMTKDLSDLFAVVAIDISLGEVTKEIESIKISQDGFLIHLTYSGVIINQPEWWTNTLSIVRLYESPDVDITYEQWLKINDTDISEDTLMSFADSNNTEYYFTRSFVYPFQDGNFSSILMVCLEKATVLDQRDKLESSYTKTFQGIFICALTLACLSFITIAVYTFIIGNSLKRQLEGIHKVLRKIVANGSKTNLVDGLDDEMFEKFQKNIENLADACIKRLTMIQLEEICYSSVEWGGGSRPSEVSQYDDWRRRRHPINVFYQTNMPWKLLIEKLAIKFASETNRKFSDTDASCSKNGGLVG